MWRTRKWWRLSNSSVIGRAASSLFIGDAMSKYDNAEIEKIFVLWFNACTQINTDILNPFLHLESISLEVFTEILRYFFLSSTFSNYINIKDLHYKSRSGKMTKPEKVCQVVPWSIIRNHHRFLLMILEKNISPRSPPIKRLVNNCLCFFAVFYRCMTSLYCVTMGWQSFTEFLDGTTFWLLLGKNQRRTKQTHSQIDIIF